MTDFYNEMRSRGPKHSQRFRIDVILSSMEGDEKASLEAALTDPDIPHVAVAEVLNNHGHTISTNAVRNWRIGQRRADRG